MNASQSTWIPVSVKSVLDIPRVELHARQLSLSALIGRLRSKSHSSPSVLSDEEFKLLEDVWQMHVELLK